MDYRSDYREIVAEVYEQVHSLAFDVITKTTSGAISRSEGKASDAEWYSVLRLLIDDLEKSVKEVSRHPHHRLVEEEVYRPMHQVKREGTQTRKWLRKHPQVFNQSNPKIPEYRKKINYDTLENQFVKYVLQRILKRLDNLYHVISINASSAKTQELQFVLREMHHRVKKLLGMGFMNRIGQFRGNNNLSLVIAICSRI